MKKFISLFWGAAAIACCFMACGNADSGGNGGGTYIFTDDLGREVTVDSYERVAALLGSYADMWVLAGGDVCAAPDDAF